MIIHRPQIRFLGAEIQISARIESDRFRQKLNKSEGRPERVAGSSDLWFRFPAQFQQQLALDPGECDPFAVALLLLAMQYNEPLCLRGSISQKLLNGLYAYQQIYHSWYPDRFHLISIQSESIRSAIADTKNTFGTAAAFSGGVDSFYTLLEMQPQITHTLFMSGFDMPLNLKASIQALTDSYSGMMQKLGIQFIHGSTNLRKFVNTVDWTNAHGQALAASALFFREQWKTFLIPSSYLVSSHPRWGTHPQLDPLLSTETLQFVHHGVDANRVFKLKRITDSQHRALSVARLRVCWIQDLGLKNCGACEKCIRTMIALKILVQLQHYTTFQDQHGQSLLTRAKMRGLQQRTHQSRLFSKELIVEAARRGKWSICFDLSHALLRRWFGRVSKEFKKMLCSL